MKITLGLALSALIVVLLGFLVWSQFEWEIRDLLDGPDRMDTLGVTFIKDSKGNESVYAILGDEVHYVSPQSRESNKLEKADPATFEVIVYDSIVDDGVLIFDYAKDANRVYSVSALKFSPKGYVTDDVANFEVLKTPEGEYSIYAKDSSQIYALGLPMQADYKTFEVVSRDTARDASTFFWEADKRN